jgi:hypothetical protein
MKRLFLAFALSVASLSPTQAAGHFFPTRPAGAITNTVTGTLLTFSKGMGVGGIRIQDDNGTIWYFYMGYPVTIDGTAVNCLNAPTATKAGFVCGNWPSGLFAGTSRVTATYWATQLHGATVQACDQLSTRAAPQSRTRKPH